MPKNRVFTSPLPCFKVNVKGRGQGQGQISGYQVHYLPASLSYTVDSNLLYKTLYIPAYHVVAIDS